MRYLVINFIKTSRKKIPFMYYIFYTLRTKNNIIIDCIICASMPQVIISEFFCWILHSNNS